MSSSASSRVRNDFDYEPAVYCDCQLKAPICTARDSGKRFYGCQKWKDGKSCGFFHWKDQFDAERNRMGVGSEGTRNQMEAIINSIEALRDEVRVVRELIEPLSQNNQFSSKFGWFFVGVVFALVMGKLL